MTKEAYLFIVRPRPFSYALLAGTPGVASVGAATVAAIAAPSLWPPALFVGLIFVAFLIWLSTTRLVLTDDALRYQSLFSRSDVHLSDIIDIAPTLGLRLFLSVRQKLDGGKSQSKDVSLNVALFDPRQVNDLVDVLKSRLSQKVGKQQAEASPSRA